MGLPEVLVFQRRAGMAKHFLRIQKNVILQKPIRDGIPYMSDSRKEKGETYDMKRNIKYFQCFNCDSEGGSSRGKEDQLE